MGIDSAIEWTDHTINFWWGCEKVSPGCAHCYAESQSKRIGEDIWGHGKPRKWIRSAAALALKLNQQAEKSGVRQRVFCQSMADFFEEDHGQSIVWSGKSEGETGLWATWHRDDIGPCAAGQTTVNRSQGERRCTLTDLRNYAFRIIDQTPWLDWQIVTKRPENIRRLWPSISESTWVANYKTPHQGSHYRHNVWLLTSVENQEQADKRIPELLKCRDLSPVLGLSMEPLLGPVNFRWAKWKPLGDGVTADLDGLRMLDWVIVGGESGPHARPLHPDLARSLRDQCVAAGVPFFYKQNGEYLVYDRKPSGEFVFDPPLSPSQINAKMQVFRNGRFEPVGKDSNVRECFDEASAIAMPVGKKRAGRLLDGVEWSQFPEVPAWN